MRIPKHDLNKAPPLHPPEQNGCKKTEFFATKTQNCPGSGGVESIYNLHSWKTNCPNIPRLQLKWFHNTRLPGNDKGFKPAFLSFLGRSKIYSYSKNFYPCKLKRLYSPGQYNCVGINPPAQILADKSFYSESRVSSRLESSRIKLFEEDETAWICQAGWW